MLHQTSLEVEMTPVPESLVIAKTMNGRKVTSRKRVPQQKGDINRSNSFDIASPPGDSHVMVIQSYHDSD